MENATNLILVQPKVSNGLDEGTEPDPWLHLLARGTPAATVLSVPDTAALVIFGLNDRGGWGGVRYGVAARCHCCVARMAVIKHKSHGCIRVRPVPAS